MSIPIFEVVLRFALRFSVKPDFVNILCVWKIVLRIHIYISIGPNFIILFESLILLLLSFALLINCWERDVKIIHYDKDSQSKLKKIPLDSFPLSSEIIRELSLNCLTLIYKTLALLWAVILCCLRVVLVNIRHGHIRNFRVLSVDLWLKTWRTMWFNVSYEVSCNKFLLKLELGKSLVPWQTESSVLLEFYKMNFSFSVLCTISLGVNLVIIFSDYPQSWLSIELFLPQFTVTHWLSTNPIWRVRNKWYKYLKNCRDRYINKYIIIKLVLW